MIKRLLTVLAALTAVCLIASPAAAQASRTWVSGVGDDANPCSRTAPCKTFAGAISKTAANGEISVLDPGGFGAVTITKSISIVAEGNEGGVLASLTNGITINSATAVVYIRGLIIEGKGDGLNGVNIVAAKNVVIENSVIRGFRAAGPANGAAVNETVNLAYGRGHTLVEAARFIGDALGIYPDIHIEPARVGEVTHYVANIGRARALLDYNPRVSLYDGIRRAITEAATASDDYSIPQIA